MKKTIIAVLCTAFIFTGANAQKGTDAIAFAKSYRGNRKDGLTRNILPEREIWYLWAAYKGDSVRYLGTTTFTRLKMGFEGILTLSNSSETKKLWTGDVKVDSVQTSHRYPIVVLGEYKVGFRPVRIACPCEKRESEADDPFLGFILTRNPLPPTKS